MSVVTTTSVGLDRVMGCRARVTVTAAANSSARLLTDAVERLRSLERCWSRFLPDSDISRLNRSGGVPLTVDRSTITLFTAMAVGARTTDGAFDPTLLVVLVGLGYGPSWGPSSELGAASHQERSWWIDATVVDPARSTIAIPDRVQLDPGAIGKGLAADIVAEQLIAGGAASARIVVGGDVRVTGPSRVGVNGPDGRPLDHVGLAAGGVATSGTSRSWITHDGHRAHHVIDPTSRRPLARSGAGDVVQVTVAAASAAHAEVHATAVLVDPSSARVEALDALGVGVLVVDQRGTARGNDAWARMRRPADVIAGAA